MMNFFELIIELEDFELLIELIIELEDFELIFEELTDDAPLPIMP